MKNGEQAAFASSSVYTLDGRQEDGTLGLTKREYLSGLAMQGLLASNDGRESDVVARHSIELADALLAYLEKEGEGR